MIDPETSGDIHSADLLASDSPDALARELLQVISQQSCVESLDDDFTSTSDLTDSRDNALRIASHAKSRPFRSVQPDLAAAAILLARALHATPGVIQQLNIGAPVIAIDTRRADLVSPTKTALDFYFAKLNVGGSHKTHSAAYPSVPLVIQRDGLARGDKPESGNDLVLSAFQDHRTIIGVSCAPKQLLPRTLVEVADFEVKLAHIDASVLALVIESVTGKPLSVMLPAELAAAVDVGDLCIAIRKQDTHERCLQRLYALVKARGVAAGAGPRLEDLAGYGDAKQWGLELAADLDSFRRGRLPWASIDKGLLLDGPPGVGKTQFAKALARSAGVPLIATSVAEWNASTYLSGTLSAIRRSFQEAQRLSPSILFIDELDGISDRSRLQGEYVEYWSQVVNLLLELLSGVEERPGVVVVGATNYAERIDSAIRRAGRLDKTITIPLPDVEDLKAILRFYLGEELHDTDLQHLAHCARGGTGADVEAWVRRAKSAARRDDRPLAIDDIHRAMRSERDYLTPHLRNAVCVHEAGHVVAIAALERAVPDAVWLTNAGGNTLSDVTLASHATLGGLERQITIMLSGRAAELILLGLDGVTVGAGAGDDSDLSRATALAFDIEARYGLGESGLLRLPEAALTSRYLDNEVRARIQDRLHACFQDATRVLSEHRGAVVAVAKELDENGFLNCVSLRTILTRHLPSL